MSLKSSTNTKANTYELILEVDAAAFDAAVENVYKRQKKNISVPGFRKGKVTRKFAEKYFGENAFWDDAINALCNSEVAAALDETKLDIVDRPAVELVSADMNNGVVLKAVLTVKPEVNIADYKGIKASKIVKEITDADVNAQIDSMRARNARIVSVDDRPAQIGDEVVIDFEGFKDGEAFDGGKAEDFNLKLGSGQFIPGFEEAVAGHSVGESFEINVTFPENYQMAELAGQPAVFKINLKEINVQELPELDDDFVKDTSDFETVDELKADTMKKLSENAENRAAADFENEIFEKVIALLDAEIPECMYENRIDRFVSEFEQRLKMQGMELSLYLQYTGMDMDSFRESHRERAVNEVKLRLALEKIAELEGFEVSDEEIENGIADIAKSNNIDADTVKRIINIDDYKTDLLVEKAANFVKENAVVDNSAAEEK
ncbi:MAG TPA: trigger factor [Ruminococcus sp.]|nr:trigger factor [Ruminococcus sp.]HBN11576.1 trigger factor [Ruminococcus sp.]HCR73870.1 trigger factor [Ruminococcus sp.]